MKSKKLLIGLIVAAFIGGVHFASAQTKANYMNNLIEIGPDNIGGRVRAMIVDQNDPTNTTLYAGGVAGGLFKLTSASSTWQYIPYFTSDNNEITLPISCMAQLPNGQILIGTGEGLVEKHGVNDDRMAPRGRGLYRFNPDKNSFKLITATNPIVNSNWDYINRVAVMTVEGDSYMYIYAGTDNGLYRWKLSIEDPDWETEPTAVITGESIQDIVMLPLDNIAYVSAPGRLYRIGNVTGQSQPVDVTTSNSAFGTSSRIELAGTTVREWDNSINGRTHHTYMYAVVVNELGLLDGVFLTMDQQNWTRLTTATVVPFNSTNPGTLNASIAIDPINPKRIFLGGATLWAGEGYVENSNYQWIKQSYSEDEMNNGNYMGTVYSNPMFVHSGIHQIIPTVYIDNGDTLWRTYFATDGGIYISETSDMYVFRSLNKGLNTVQFNEIAVTPDGSIIGGAIDNSCPFIQARNAHHGSIPTNEWYDNDPNSIINHMSNIIWNGNGGGVATSRFQQILPFTRRTVFVSSEPGRFSYLGRDGYIDVASYARACNDYADYTNTQTWTIADAFTANSVLTSNPIPKMRIWETTNNTIWNDSITFTIDTNVAYIHNGEEAVLTGNTQIVPGDKVLVASKPNYDYPFYHTFTETFTVKDRMTHTVPNKVISRMIVTGRNISSGSGTVYITLTPNYFRNVWSFSESSSTDPNTLNKLMHWATLYAADAGYTVGDVAFSRDGTSIFIAVTNDATGKSFIFRIYDFTLADANNPLTMKTQLRFQKDYVGNPRITHFDTIFAADGNWFNRPITSLCVDPRDNEDNLIITFGGYNNGDPNMVYVKNATSPSRIVTNIPVINNAANMSATDPVYSALVECTHGIIYAGTEKGVFTATNANSPNWQNFGSFNGVPVTSIVQQTSNLPSTHYTTREGVNDVTYLFAKTKYPYAIYFGTYGRGIFMDTTFVTDHVAEVCDSNFWGINVVDNGQNSMKIYPNPAITTATLDLSIVKNGNAVIKIYDITGKLVHSEKLGYLSEGDHHYTIDCSKFSHGMYLVNVNIGNESATSKFIVR